MAECIKFKPDFQFEFLKNLALYKSAGSRYLLGVKVFHKPGTALVMERAPQIILFLLLFIHFGVAQNATRTRVDEFPVGVILDLQTLVGKIARTSILMALDDFYSVHKNYSTKIVLHIRDAKSDNVQAASEGNCSAVLQNNVPF